MCFFCYFLFLMCSFCRLPLLPFYFILSFLLFFFCLDLIIDVWHILVRPCLPITLVTFAMHRLFNPSYCCLWFEFEFMVAFMTFWSMQALGQWCTAPVQPAFCSQLIDWVKVLSLYNLVLVSSCVRGRSSRITTAYTTFLQKGSWWKRMGIIQVRERIYIHHQVKESYPVSIDWVDDFLLVISIRIRGRKTLSTTYTPEVHDTSRMEIRYGCVSFNRLGSNF